MKIAFSKLRSSLSRALRPLGLGKIPGLNLLLYEVTPEREQIIELGRRVYKLFPRVRASVDFGHSGGALLEGILDQHIFVLEYWPSDGYGVTSDPEPFTTGAEHRFDSFDQAEKCFLALLHAEIARGVMKGRISN